MALLAVVSTASGLCAATVEESRTFNGTDVTFSEDTVISNLIVSSQTKVTVNSGVTVDVINYAGSALMKLFGSGTMRITDLAGTDGKIEANQSVVLRFLAPSATTDTHSLASSATFHVDAMDAASFTSEIRGGVNYVSKWSDVRGGGYMNAANADEATQPFLVDSAFPWLDTGSYWVSSKAETAGNHGGYLAWSSELNDIREVFLVVSDTDDVRSSKPKNVPAPFLLSSVVRESYDFHRGRDNYAMFGSDYASELITNGTITLDRAVAGPYDPLPTGFHLVHIRTTGNVNASAFANDRALRRGGQRLQEAIVFSSPLGEEVSAELEKRLYAKWIRSVNTISMHGTARVEAEYPVSINTFNSSPGDNNVISGDFDVLKAQLFGLVTVESGRMAVTGNGTIGDIVGNVYCHANSTIYRKGGEDSLVKSSVGDVSVRSLAASNITVQSGSLSVEMLSPSLGSYFHVDAAATDTMTFSGTKDGMSLVKQWRCVRGQNKRYATATNGVMPFLRSAYLNGLPVVDFGTLKYTNKSQHDFDDGYGGFIAWNHTNTVIREVFWVYSDTEDWKALASGSPGPFLLGGGLKGGTYDFHRNTAQSAIAFGGSAAECVKTGTFRMDGVEATSPTAAVINPGFHVLHLRTKDSGAASASNFGNDRGYVMGGQRLAEVIVYTEQTSDVERDAVEAYLRNKWFDAGVPGGEYATVSVASNASVALPRYATAALVQGPGTVVVRGGLTARGVAGGPSFTGDLTLAENATVTVADLAAMSVSGTLTLPESATIVLEGRLPPSSGTSRVVTVMEAGSFAGAASLSGWQVDASSISPLYNCRVFLDGSAVKVELTRGLIMMVF